MEGWLLNCFFLSFSNRENYSNKDISVYTIKACSKIKTKVTCKQNLEHFKMTIQIFFIHNFCTLRFRIIGGVGNSRTALAKNPQVAFFVLNHT